MSADRPGPFARATILGCGSSTGVPRIDGDWGACDPNEPRNRRRRCSLLVERFNAAGEATRVLVDTGADLRDQILSVGAPSLDGVLYTHEHADHTHGIDDLRVIAIRRRARVPIYANPMTAEVLRARFGYCFETPPASGYPPILDLHEIEPSAPVTIDGPGGPLTARAFAQIHGDIVSLGYRFGNLAYSSDLNDLPPTSLATLEGTAIWIVDALRWRPHPTHLSVDGALGWIETIGVRQAILTNMHMDLDYRTLAATLPEHVEPAYDGLAVDFDPD